jgi:hypothetical protein
MFTDRIIELLGCAIEKLTFLILLTQLDTKTRLCIRDSLLRLAYSAAERQIDGDRSSTNKTKKDEDEASENDASTRRTR